MSTNADDNNIIDNDIDNNADPELKTNLNKKMNDYEYEVSKADFICDAPSEDYVQDNTEPDRDNSVEIDDNTSVGEQDQDENNNDICNKTAQRIEEIQNEIEKLTSKLDDYTTKKDYADAILNRVENMTANVITSSKKNLLCDIAQLRNNYCAFCKIAATSDKDKEQLLKDFEAFEIDFDILLEKNDVEPFELSEVVKGFQTIYKFEKTSDEALDKTIAMSYAPGYKLGGKVMMAQKISVYRYEAGEQL